MTARSRPPDCLEIYSHPSPPCHAIYVLAGLTWHLVVYADGITPGSVLAHDNRRKSVVWYCSFMEFHEKLAQEEVWTAIALARTC